MNLTPDQQIALDDIIEFIYTPVKEREDVAGILYAAAGCGKTFLTRVIVNKVRGTHRIAGVAPTHKARKVLDGFLNSNTLLKVKTMTIASLLNTMRSHSYIGTKHYVRGADSKMHLFDLFLIDEASMITDNDVELIISYAFEFKRKVLFIGDKFQIPNPSQKYICRDGVATKRDSVAFELAHAFGLTTNVRQSENNPIVDLYTEFRDAIAERREPKISRKSKMRGELGVRFYTSRQKWYDEIQSAYLNLETEIHNVRILAYTNDTVRSHNLMIRRIFKRGPKPEVGELLMGYNNLGWPEKIIENSQDYYVIDTVHTILHTVAPEISHTYRRLVGEIVTIKETDSEHKSVIFIPDLAAPENQDMLQDLVKRAERVNRRGSTKDDFKKYCRLNNKLVFMENVYNYGTEIMGEGEFRTNNPLLFKSVSDMIEDADDGDRTVLDNKLSKDVQNKYGAILTERIGDDKPLAGTERLCDRYCVIEKDLDYGVCITSHKSQGSNFTTVFVDEADFDKLHNYWSYTLDCQIEATKERNQLKYVSFTRPTTSAHVFYRK
jgi:hypothetical protein